MYTNRRIYLPLSEGDIETLHAGDRVFLTGELIVARDAAHKRLIECLERGEELPVDLTDSLIFYAGPTPAPEGKVIGSVGPTTACRMDSYAIKLMEKLRLTGSIGKGQRSDEFKEACQKHRCLYFAATGGVAALMHQHITASEVIAYEDLGPEAIRRLTVQEFPVIVANDIYGNDIFEMGKDKFKK